MIVISILFIINIIVVVVLILQHNSIKTIFEELDKYNEIKIKYKSLAGDNESKHTLNTDRIQILSFHFDNFKDKTLKKLDKHDKEIGNILTKLENI